MAEKKALGLNNIYFAKINQDNDFFYLLQPLY